MVSSHSSLPFMLRGTQRGRLPLPGLAPGQAGGQEARRLAGGRAGRRLAGGRGTWAGRRLAGRAHPQ